MRRLSSKWTWWHKKGFPTVWFGFLALFTAIWTPVVLNGEVPAPTLLIPIGMAVFGYVLHRCLRIFSFMDEVWLDGDELVLRNKGDEERFSISRIKSARSSVMTSPPNIVVALEEPCRFGEEFVFTPESVGGGFGPHPLAAELMGLAQKVRAANRR